jgi:hypothetical protein
LSAFYSRESIYTFFSSPRNGFPSAKTRTQVLAVILQSRDDKQITVPEPPAKME